MCPIGKKYTDFYVIQAGKKADGGFFFRERERGNSLVEHMHAVYLFVVYMAFKITWENKISITFQDSGKIRKLVFYVIMCLIDS